MKEIKVYVDELPEDCTDCPCYDFDIGGCQCKDPHFTYQSIDRFKGCPLIDIKTHDRELVKEVCEKIREHLSEQKKSLKDTFSPYSNGKAFIISAVEESLNKIEKEFEK